PCPHQTTQDRNRQLTRMHRCLLIHSGVSVLSRPYLQGEDCANYSAAALCCAAINLLMENPMRMVDNPIEPEQDRSMMDSIQTGQNPATQDHWTNPSG